MGKDYNDISADHRTMATHEVIVSIIIVHYRAQKELFACIASIVASNPRIPYEIIVADNDEEKTIEKVLIEAFPFVSYIKSPGNVGFGAGNNIGVAKSRGKYLFFLNPDTKIALKTIDRLVAFLDRYKDAGVVAPLILDQNKKPYDIQGTTELNPIIALFVLTFLNKYFPQNPISHRYFLRDWDREHARRVDVVPGAAFVVRKDVFERVGGFDEEFFLYFEETDFCRRVKQLEIGVYLDPKVKVVHLGGKSTSQNRRRKNIFAQSRFYYFKKHFGLFSAIVVHIMTMHNPLRRLFKSL